MRSFIISVLGVSVFFIGLSALIREADAKFGSDDQSMELIKKAKVAIGGQSNIEAVKSMTISGVTEPVVDRNGSVDSMKGTVEINFQFPDRYSKIVKFGSEGDDKNANRRIERVVVRERELDDVEIKDGNKKSEIIVFKGDHDAETDDVKIDADKITITKKDGTIEEIKIHGKDDVFIHEKGKGDANVWTSDDGKKIIIKKKDGTTEEIETDGKHKVFVHKEGDGEWTSDDGKKIVIEKIDGSTDVKNDENHRITIHRGSGDNGKRISDDGNELIIEREGVEDAFFVDGIGKRQNEFLQTTLALLLTPPEGLDVSYKFLGTGNVDGKSSNIIEVTAKQATFKLFLDASTNLPQMITYKSTGHRMAFFRADKMEDSSKNRIKGKMSELHKKGDDELEVEHQIKFSDFRKVGKLLLPHKWSHEVGDKKRQNITITSFNINPANIDDKFKHEEIVKMRVEKKSNK